MPKATVIKKQSYETFIYNSAGAQSGNRYNSWSDLMTAITRQEGAKTIYFEQDETIPSGSWNLDYVTLRGNGAEYNAGGYTLTFGDNTTISSWLVPSFHSLLLKSTSTTGHICTFTTAFSLVCDTVTNIQSSSSYEFFASSYEGQNILAIRNSARLQLVNGSTKELFKFTGAAMTQQVILSMGDGAAVQDDTLSSTNSVIYIPIIASANQALANWPPSHTNLSVGFQLDLNLTNALALMNTPAGNIAATDVQTAINELDTEKLALAGGTLTDGANIGVGSTTGTKIGTATTQKLGFFNATPVVQPAEITDELTTITHTAPGTPDYAIAAPVDSSGGAAFGFSTADEFNTVMSVIANLQTRNKALEDVLHSLGLLADAD